MAKDVVRAYEKWAGTMRESGDKKERDEWLQGLGCFKLGWNERDEEIAALRERVRLLKAALQTVMLHVDPSDTPDEVLAEVAAALEDK